MKNLKMFAIAVMAFAVMAMGVHAAPITLAGKCTETTVTDKCTLKAPLVIGQSSTEELTIDKDLTIVTTATNKITINATNGELIIADGKKLTIEGGNVELKGKITVNDSATLTITGAKDDTWGIRVSGTALIDVKNGGTLDVSNNDNRGIVGLAGTSTIQLYNATMKVNNNTENAMNGSVTIKADYSKIEATENGLGGLNAKFELHHGTKVTATKNGLAGVVIEADSSIDEGCEINASGNLTGKAADEARKKTLSERADVTLKGALTVAGKLTADSIAPEKVLWEGNQVGTVATNVIVTLRDGGVVDAKESKALCNASDQVELETGKVCPKDKSTAISATGDGILVVGETGTVYGTKEVQVPAGVKKVVVNSEANLVVGPGTEVENKSGKAIFVKTTDGKIYEVEAGKTATLGEAAPTPEEQQPGTEGEGSGNQGPTDNVKNPETNDNILVYAGLGLVSLATVTFTARKRED